MTSSKPTVTGSIRPESGPLEVGAKVRMNGCDHGGAGTVLALRDDTIVVKWPGHMGWAGVGQRAYAPGSIAVYRLDAGGTAGVIEWSTGRR